VTGWSQEHNSEHDSKLVVEEIFVQCGVTTMTGLKLNDGAKEDGDRRNER